MIDKERRRVFQSVEEIEAILDRKIREHEVREAELLETRFSAFKDEAFPDGSYAHRLAHKAMIEAAADQREFWATLRNEVITKSIWGILRILTVLLVAGVVAKFGIGPAYLAWLAK